MIDLRLLLLCILSLKTCTRCGQMKSLTEFYTNGKWTMPHCKECESRRKRNQYQAGKLELRATRMEL